MDMIAKISSSGLLTMILIAFHRTSTVLHKTSVTGSPPFRHIMPDEVSQNLYSRSMLCCFV